jgi:hypothetical protein
MNWLIKLFAANIIRKGIEQYKRGKHDEATAQWREALHIYIAAGERKSLSICFSCFDWSLIEFEDFPTYSAVCSKCGNSPVLRLG